MRYRIASSIVAATLAIPGTAVAAHAGPVRIAQVQYDSPGADTRSNRSLNAEWVRIKNYGKKAKNLKGWTIRDPQGHVYKFGRLKLRPGKSVKLHTGNGRDSRSDRYWRQNNYVWNNDGDKALLKNKNRKRVDTCRWGDGDGNILC